MFSRFFIDRPIFASVIAIVIIILGVLVAMVNMPWRCAPLDRQARRRSRAEGNGRTYVARPGAVGVWC